MKELYQNTWTEMDEFVRIFMAAGSEKALIIDTGMTGLDVCALAKAALAEAVLTGRNITRQSSGACPQEEEHTDLPCELLITHADGDHISGKHHFAKVLMHPSEAFLYRQHVREVSADELGSVKSGADEAGAVEAVAVEAVFEGDVIDLGNRELEVIHLPGHTPGSITLLDREARCLIGGDPIQEGGEIYMFGPYRDMEMYIASLERLMKRDDFDWVYPSHSKEKVSRNVIPELIRGAKAILAGEIRGEEAEVHGQVVRSIDIGPVRFLYQDR